MSLCDIGLCFMFGEQRNCSWHTNLGVMIDCSCAVMSYAEFFDVEFLKML